MEHAIRDDIITGSLSHASIVPEWPSAANKWRTGKLDGATTVTSDCVLLCHLLFSELPREIHYFLFIVYLCK